MQVVGVLGSHEDQARCYRERVQSRVEQCHLLRIIPRCYSHATIKGLMIPGELNVAVLNTVTSDTKWASASAKENMVRW
jgi:hypothetical protein